MSVNETKPHESKPKKYVLVPPDGGWGYMIWIAITITMISTTAFVSCIGMMYNEIYIQLNMDSASITLLNGVGSISVSLAAFITGPLLHFLSLRQFGLIIIIIFNLGSLLSAFANSLGLLFFAYAILQAFGNGALVNLTFTALNQYFDKKRMLTVSVAQTITTVVTLFTPQIVKWASEEYGCRGTLILITGIYMHTFIAITLMQPVEWHMKKKEIGIITEDKEELKTLLKNEKSEKEKITLSAKQLENEALSLVPTEKKELGECDVKKNKTSIFRLMFSDFFDVAFLKSFLLSNASIGLALCSFSDIIFMLMLPQALYAMDWTEGEVAFAVSISSFGDLITKILFILFNNFLLKFGNNELYIVGLIVAFFARLGMLWSDNPTVMLVFIVLIGMARSMIGVLYPLVIGDAVDKDKFTSAVGMFMLLYGAIFLVLGPIIGAIRDLTHSYGTAFYIITSCYGIVILFWLIELLYKKNKDKREKNIKSRETA